MEQSQCRAHVTIVSRWAPCVPLPLHRRGWVQMPPKTRLVPPSSLLLLLPKHPTRPRPGFGSALLDSTRLDSPVKKKRKVARERATAMRKQCRAGSPCRNLVAVLSIMVEVGGGGEEGCGRILVVVVAADCLSVDGDPGSLACVVAVGRTRPGRDSGLVWSCSVSYVCARVATARRAGRRPCESRRECSCEGCQEGEWCDVAAPCCSTEEKKASRGGFKSSLARFPRPRPCSLTCLPRPRHGSRIST